jgi:hypothetical protein
VTNLRIDVLRDGRDDHADCGATVIAVSPKEEHGKHRRLFDALEAITDAHFVAVGTARDDVVGTVAFGEDASRGDSSQAPVFLVTSARHSRERGSGTLKVSDSSQIDRALKGLTLPHREPDAPLTIDSATEVLAAIGGEPAWVRRGNVDKILLDLDDLESNETLRERLSSTECLPVLALIEFLRRVDPAPWTPPRAHACFLFDDPNLHAASYGFVDFRSIVTEARRDQYHAAFATIPLDAWFARESVVRIFRDNSSRLSLLVHGNDHIRRELARDVGSAGHRQALAQGLRRVRRLEERHGIGVDRVMAPPHGACSPDAADELLLLGFEALCASRPYPWLVRPPTNDPAAGSRPADFVGKGLPVIPRFLIASATSDELAIRSFLRQPLVLYGHHGDLSGGLDVLSHASNLVAAVADASWTSTKEIARSLYATRLKETRLDVRLFTRHVEVVVPEGVAEIVVSTAYPLGPLDRVAVQPVCDGRVTVRVERRESIDPASIPSPLPAVWPILRRGLSETRDRLQPVARRARSRAGANG